MVRAIRFHETGGPDVLRYEDVEVRAPGAGEVRRVAPQSPPTEGASWVSSLTPSRLAGYGLAGSSAAVTSSAVTRRQPPACDEPSAADATAASTESASRESSEPAAHLDESATRAAGSASTA